MSLVVWLPLLGNTNNQGLSDIAVVNNGATVNNSGKLGKCYSFGTSTSYLTLSNDAVNKCTTECSLSFWLNITSWNTSYATYFQAGLGSAPWAHYIFGVLRSGAGSNLCFTISDGSSASNASYATPNLELNTWYHLTFVYKTGHCLIYIDGELYKDYATTIVPNFSGITKTTVGACNNGSSYQTNCKLNDIRIYDHALSPKEVSEIAKGLVCHYQLNNDARGGLPNLLKYSKVNSVNQSLLSTYSSAWTSKMTIANIDSYDCYHYPSVQNSTWFSSGYWYSGLAANTTYTYSAYIYFTATVNFSFTSLGHFQVYNASSTASDKSHEDVVSARIYEPSTITANTWTKIRITFTTNSLDGSKFCIYPRYNIAANTGDLYFRDCKLELGDKPTAWTPNASDNEYTQLGYNENIIYDSSGFSNNSKAVNNIFLSPDTPRNTISTRFVDNTSTVTITPCFSAGQTLTELSVSIWYRTNTLNSTAPNLWSLGENNFVRIRIANATSLWYYIRVGSTQVGAAFAASKTLTDDTWHHVVLTFKDGVVVMYLDGNQIGTTDHSATATYLTCNSVGTTWHLGGYTATAEKFIGSLSDFRLYTTCLSVDAVKQLYNTPVSIANNGSMLTQGEFVEL